MSAGSAAALPSTHDRADGGPDQQDAGPGPGGALAAPGVRRAAHPVHADPPAGPGDRLRGLLPLRHHRPLPGQPPGREHPRRRARPGRSGRRAAPAGPGPGGGAGARGHGADHRREHAADRGLRGRRVRAAGDRAGVPGRRRDRTRHRRGRVRHAAVQHRRGRPAAVRRRCRGLRARARPDVAGAPLAGLRLRDGTGRVRAARDPGPGPPALGGAVAAVSAALVAVRLPRASPVLSPGAGRC